MSKKIAATLIVRLDDDKDGQKAELVRTRLLRKAMKRRDKNDRVIVDNEIETEKPRKARRERP